MTAGQQRRPASTLAEYTGPAGQDDGELFDIYLPPTPDALASGLVASTAELRRDEDPPSVPRVAPRSQAHAEGLWHRSVHVWVLEPASRRVLLQQRSAHKDTFPNALRSCRSSSDAEKSINLS